MLNMFYRGDEFFMGKISAYDRREEIKDLIAVEGLTNINNSKLARKFNVSPTMIGKDIDKILSGIPDEKIEQLLAKLHYQFKRALMVSESLLDSVDDNTKLKAAMVLKEVIKEFKEFLKSTGRFVDAKDIPYGYVSTVKYNSLVDDYNSLIDLRDDFKKNLEEYYKQVNKKIVQQRLNSYSQGVDNLMMGAGFALKICFDNGKITEDEYNDYIDELEGIVFSTAKKYVESKEFNDIIMEPMIPLFWDKKEENIVEGLET